VTEQRTEHVVNSSHIHFEFITFRESYEKSKTVTVNCFAWRGAVVCHVMLILYYLCAFNSTTRCPVGCVDKKGFRVPGTREKKIFF